MAVAVVVAAGRGTRLGLGVPKALVPLAGRPLLGWCLRALQDAPEVRRVVVVLPAGTGLPADPAAWGLETTDGLLAAAGGAERAHSVRAGLHALAPVDPGEPVLVHDAARPMLTPTIVTACLSPVLAGADAAVAAAPMTDTVKEAEPAPPAGAGSAPPRVARTLDRRRLWAVQTPQVFRADVLADALAVPDAVLAAATDEAQLVEARGGDVRLVPTTAGNRKVTTPEDLVAAAAVLHRSAGGGGTPRSPAPTSDPRVFSARPGPS